MKKFFLILLLISLSARHVWAQSDELLQGIRELMQKYQEGAYADILSASEKMLAMAEKEFGVTDPNYAIVLAVVASAQAQMGYAEKAEKNYFAALDGLKNAPGEYASFSGRIYFGLGEMYHARGEYEKAESFYLKSLPIYAKTVGRDGPDYANTLNDLGNLYKDIGEFTKSEKNLKDAAEIRKNVLGENNPAYGVSLNNLGSLYETMGDYRNAALFYERSYNIWKSTLGEYHPLIATAFNNYAGLYLKVGSYPEAEKFYLLALKVCEKVYGTKHDRYVTTLSNLGNLYRSMQKFQEAEKYATQCLQIRKETLGTRHIDYAYSLNNLGLIKMDIGDFKTAQKLLTEALELFKTLLGKNHKNVAVCANNLGVTHVRQNDPVKATQYLKQSLAISLNRIDYVFPAINDREKTYFYNTIQSDFEFFNTFAALNYKSIPELAGDMFNYTIATKALLLNASNKVKRRIMTSGDATLIGLFNDWKLKKNRLAQVWQMSESEKSSGNIDEGALEAEVNALEKKLAASSELFASHNDRVRYTWKDIQRKLKADEAAIEIVRFRKFNFEFTDTAYYAALIVKPGIPLPEVVIFGNGNFMDTKLLTLYKNSIKLKLQDEKSYDGFWRPIALKLQGTKKVYLCPDGAYNQINLNSLYNPQTKKFLIDELEVQQVTNTRDLLALPRKTSIRNAIMIGFPDYKTLPESGKVLPDETPATITDSLKREFETTINALPGTLTEVNLISKIFKEKNITTEIATGMSANEAFLKKLQSPSVLHIATHGYFLSNIETKGDSRGSFMGVDPVKADENPLLRSGILLAGAQKTISGVRTSSEDGILSAYEAMNLNLDDTELVVLSACETGLGEVHNGEGVYGFQRALIIAGAQAIVMSLWKVNDQTTQELMTAFYSFWMEGKSKREAFLLAQNKIRSNHPEPYFWAPFILIGD
jgi:CHAT domain-containing protein/tetratricopeptide (TPR) repeat protein